MKPVLRVHKRTREVAGRYSSYAEAARESGASISTIQYTAKENAIPSGDYYFRFAEDFDPDEDFTGKKNCPVVARDTATGRVAWYGCTNTAAEKLHVPVTSIYHSINDKTKVKRRLVFAYYGRRLP